MSAVFYAPDAQADAPFELPEEESRHALRVLRLQPGEILLAADGRGKFYKARLDGQQGARAVCTALEVTEDQLSAGYRLHIAIGITKTSDRLEWFVEKAVEIGIHRITPLLTRRCERKKVNTERLERIALAAMKQSRRAVLPVVDPLTSLPSFLAEPISGERYVAHCEDRDKSELSSLLSSRGEYTVLIGPEGDFHPEEIADTLRAGFLPVSLGPARLRTETAGVYAAVAAQITNNK